MIITIHSAFEDAAVDIPDCSVDLLLTDPPYNISSKKAQPVWVDADGNNKNTIHDMDFSNEFEHDWDDVSNEDFIKLLRTWSGLWNTKLKKGAAFAIFISDRYLSHLWSSLEESGLEPKRVIVWKKPAAVPFNRKVNPVSGCEFIVWGIKPKGTRKFNYKTNHTDIHAKFTIADKVSSIVYKNVRKDFTGVDSLKMILDNSESEAKKVIEKMYIDGSDSIVELVIPNTITFSSHIHKRIHPTEKPVELLEYFISLLTNKGDIVLDTFAGSGSTGKAADNLSRSSILIERDNDMYNKMSERLS